MIPPDRCRASIIESLWILASKRIQLEYQERVPFAPVQVEIFCQWEDLYCPSVKTFEDAFSEEERACLAAFEKLIDEVCAQEIDFPSLDDYQSSSICQRVSAAALETLAFLDEPTIDAG